MLLAGGLPVGAAEDSAATRAAQVSADATSARQVIDDAIPKVLEVLGDKSRSRDDKARRIDEILQANMDFPTLSRLMLGSSWDNATPAQRDAFIKEFSLHLMGVYLPLTDGYTNQKVALTEDRPERRNDHTAVITISDAKGSRAIALVICRLRQFDRGWKVIDMKIEGVSLAVVFGAQFRPVVASAGFDGLVKQLHEKNSAAPGKTK